MLVVSCRSDGLVASGDDEPELPDWSRIYSTLMIQCTATFLGLVSTECPETVLASTLKATLG